MSGEAGGIGQGAASSPIRHACCHCGGLALACHGEPARISMCHCHACQRRTGSVFSVQAWYPKADVRMAPGRERSYVRVADGGARLTFRFCAECGSTVWWEAEARPDMIAVAVGCFADHAFPPPRHSVWERRRHPWGCVPTTAQRSD